MRLSGKTALVTGGSRGIGPIPDITGEEFDRVMMINVKFPALAMRDVS
jgi:short-subunit dehydrogenase involved in D-alanine esterification of teichoic acids